MSLREAYAQGAFQLMQIESVLVDGDEAIPDVTIAARVLSRSEAGDADAEFLVSQAAGHELREEFWIA